MNKARIQWGVFIVISVLFIAGIVTVNLWIGRQVKGIEQGLTVTPAGDAPDKPVAHIRDRTNGASAVKIDPKNDLLAPRVKEKSFLRGPINTPQPNAQEIFEQPGKSHILIQ